MKLIYLDANILIAYFSDNKKELPKKKIVEDSLEIFKVLEDVKLYTSMWAVSEMVNILIFGQGMDRTKVGEIERQFIQEKRLGELKIDFLEVSPKNDYDFNEFFYHIRSGILKYHSGVGDIIHSIIMKNNDVSIILTFDEKDDFKEIPGLMVLSPRNVRMKK